MVFGYKLLLETGHYPQDVSLLSTLTQTISCNTDKTLSFLYWNRRKDAHILGMVYSGSIPIHLLMFFLLSALKEINHVHRVKNFISKIQSNDFTILYGKTYHLLSEGWRKLNLSITTYLAWIVTEYCIP